MTESQWSPDFIAVKDIDSAEAEWRRALAAKGQIDANIWMEKAMDLRQATAVLRDALLPIADVRARFERLVDEMSGHLPERRNGGR